MKKAIIISAVAALIAITGCSNQKNTTPNSVSSKPVKMEIIRKSDLTKENENLPVVEYHAPAPVPGQVKPFKKSFVTAPPMIPHSVEGMVPIKVGKNMCLNCHMPQNAKALGVTPIPKSHFKSDGRLSGRRYFCTTCHTPQAKVPLAVKNKFESLKSKAGVQ